MFTNKSKKNSWLELKEYGGGREKKRSGLFPWLLIFPDWMN